MLLFFYFSINLSLRGVPHSTDSVCKGLSRKAALEFGRATPCLPVQDSGFPRGTLVLLGLPPAACVGLCFVPRSTSLARRVPFHLKHKHLQVSVLPLVLETPPITGNHVPEPQPSRHCVIRVLFPTGPKVQGQECHSHSISLPFL